MRAAALLALLAAGCGDDAGDLGSGAPGSTTSTSVATSTTAEPHDTTTTESTMDDGDETPRTGQVEAAVADLAARRDVDPGDIEVARVEAVTWRDGSLGCPREGFMYPQVLTEGVRIVLAHAGEHVRYHAGSTGDPFLCEHPEEPASVG